MLGSKNLKVLGIKFSTKKELISEINYENKLEVKKILTNLPDLLATFHAWAWNHSFSIIMGW